MPSAMPCARRFRLLLPALLAVGLVLSFALAGCGGSTVYRTDRPVLRLTLDEYRIIPSNVVVKPGRLKFIVHNVGRLPHNLVIQIPAKDPSDQPVEVPGGRVETMQPGETATPIKLTLRPGKYRMVDTIGNHDDLGQYGTIHVEG
jgi:hypothetical protein